MHKPQQQIEDFHRALGMTVGETPAIRDGELRAELILEEAVETACALIGADKTREILHRFAGLPLDTDRDPNGEPYKKSLRTNPDLAEAIDGLCDGLVVHYGTAVTLGVDLEPFFDEVNRTNSAKVGGPVRADGKRLKPPGWQPPRIREMLDDLLAGIVRERYTIAQVDGYGERDIVAAKEAAGFVWCDSRRVDPDYVEITFIKR